MSNEHLPQPPALPPVAPPDENSSMDEFEIKQAPNGKQPSKSAQVKLLLSILGGVILLMLITGIVILALQRTGDSLPTATPTPAPTVIQATAAPTPAKDLPVEWLNIENNLNAHKTNLTRSNDERGKLSVPTINFETTLQE